MNRILYTLFFLVIAHSSIKAQSYYDEGAKAYSQAQYTDAIKAFERVLATSIQPSAEMYYNLANAYYKNGELAYAILNYERAYRLNPSDEDIKYNLELARSKTEDNITHSPAVIFQTFWRNITLFFKLSTWMAMSLLTFAVFVILLLLYVMGNRREWRLCGLYGAVVMFILCVLCTSFSLASHNFINDKTEAILVSPLVTLKSSPDQSAKDLVVLHTGVKVKTSQSLNKYTEVTLLDGTVGWVPNSSIELIYK